MAGFCAQDSTPLMGFIKFQLNEDTTEFCENKCKEVRSVCQGFSFKVLGKNNQCILHLDTRDLPEILQAEDLNEWDKDGPVGELNSTVEDNMYNKYTCYKSNIYQKNDTGRAFFPCIQI